MLVQSKRFDSGYKPEPTKNEYPRLRRCVNSHFFSFTTNHRLSFGLDWKAYLVVRWLICCLSISCFSSALLPMQIKMESAGNTINMVFLDACRDNPFAWSSRSGSKGLAQMDVPSGSQVVFDAAPCSLTADSRGWNGIFTKNLLLHRNTPGLLADKWTSFQTMKNFRICWVLQWKQEQTWKM